MDLPLRKVAVDDGCRLEVDYRNPTPQIDLAWSLGTRSSSPARTLSRRDRVGVRDRLRNPLLHRPRHRSPAARTRRRRASSSRALRHARRCRCTHGAPRLYKALPKERADEEGHPSRLPRHRRRDDGRYDLYDALHLGQQGRRPQARHRRQELTRRGRACIDWSTPAGSSPSSRKSSKTSECKASSRAFANADRLAARPHLVPLGVETKVSRDTCAHGRRLSLPCMANSSPGLVCTHVHRPIALCFEALPDGNRRRERTDGFFCRTCRMRYHGRGARAGQRLGARRERLERLCRLSAEAGL